MPAVIPIAAAAVGVGASAIAGAAGVGKNPYRASNFGDTNKYDPNRFEYGGAPGGANAAAGRYQNTAEWSQTRQAAQAQAASASGRKAPPRHSPRSPCRPPPARCTRHRRHRSTRR